MPSVVCLGIGADIQWNPAGGGDLLIGKYSKTCLKRPLSKRPKIGFQYQVSLNAGQKYCRMLQGEHSAILSTFIKLPSVIKIFIGSAVAQCLTRDRRAAGLSLTGVTASGP